MSAHLASFNSASRLTMLADRAFSPPDFATQSQKVDDYWMAHLPK